jgi:tetratricopeptide (TPR) repeat protein
MPGSAAPLSGRGKTYLALDKPHAAIRDFSRAVTVDGRFAAAYRNRAEAKLAVEHYTEAIEDLSRAVAFDPGNAEIYLLRGHAYLDTDNTISALKDFSRVIELDGASPAGYRARGLAEAYAEELDNAFTDLNKAIELDPRSALSFAYRAVVYKLSKQADIGAKDVATAEKLDAALPEVAWARAEIAEADGRREEAIADLKTATAKQPGFHQALVLLERLGAGSDDAGDVLVPGAGLDRWRVVKRSNRYFAVSDDYGRLRVPLEMMSDGVPKLVDWEVRKAPLKGIGVLRFAAGMAPGKSGDEPIELAAIVDTLSSTIVAIEPNRQGGQASTWTWDDGKVTVASVDGVTDELPLRGGGALAKAKDDDDAPAQSAKRSSEGRGEGGKSWGSWQAPRSAPRRHKSLFDLLFN